MIQSLRKFFPIWAAIVLAGFAIGASLQSLQQRATSIDPVINTSFADPSIFQDDDGTWYAVATNGDGRRVPVAKASAPGGPWTFLSEDLMPNVSGWSSLKDLWAPDVRKIGSTYVMYYTARHATKGIHCVGTATSTVVLGPYKPQESPIACHFSAGGSIDPSGFTDVDGTHYVVYKIDGNSVGHGGSCGNTVEPIVSTPLMLQQLKADGITPVGAPIQVLDRGEYDGPLIEAPSLLYYEGVYFLFFSSNCYSTTLYDVSYATASSVKGPFTKSAKPLMVTDNPFTITAPGGATVTVDGKNLVFHANCDHGRCMFERSIKISGKIVTME